MNSNKTKTIYNARKINKMRCIAGLAMCSAVIILTAVALVFNITDFYNESTPEAGIGTLRMYTTLSNILATLAASICIPFQIDGLRKNKYKLPRWVVEVMFVGTVGVFLTFLVAVSFISITNGFYYAMFFHSNIFMHTLNPIFITLLFTVAVSDWKIKFNRAFFTIIPTFIYAFIYFIMVCVVKSWRDHYQIVNVMPWPITFILIMLIAFSISLLLMFLHNSTKELKNITKNLLIMNLKRLLTQLKNSLKKNRNIIQKATISIFQSISSSYYLRDIKHLLCRLIFNTIFI